MSRIIIIGFIAVILYSLGSGLYYLIRDAADSRRIAKALTFRIGLSLALFIFLIIGFNLGWLHPHPFVTRG